MRRISISLAIATLFAAFAVVVTPACTVTNQNDDCEDDDDCDEGESCDDGECVEDAGEGEGEGEEGEGEGECAAGTTEDNDDACTDGCDNDGDGFIDCVIGGQGDFDCQDAPICNPPETDCSNGVDDNGNTFTDCQDFSCDDDPACTEDCSNGLDDDGDGREDCADGFCEGDAACAAGVVQTQDIQDGTVGAGATVTIENVFVTVRLDATPGVTLFLQEPDGEGNGHTYPEFAGIGFFVGSAFVEQLGDLATAAVGDCVSTSAEVSERSDGTQLFFVSSFVSSAGCGTAPGHTVVDIADIASDNNAAIDNQPGPLAEQYEGVLVEVQNVEVAGDPNDFGEVPVIAQGGDANVVLLLDGFLLGDLPETTVGQQFSAVRGVYNQFVSYKLQPVSAGDLVE